MGTGLGGGVTDDLSDLLALEVVLEWVELVRLVEARSFAAMPD